jgi:hypothetical protein
VAIEKGIGEALEKQEVEFGKIQSAQKAKRDKEEAEKEERQAQKLADASADFEKAKADYQAQTEKEVALNKAEGAAEEALK